MADEPTARQHHINVRATADEYRRIQQGAERHGLSLSEFLRVLGSSEQWAIDQQDKLREWQAMLTQMDSIPTPLWTTVAQEARERAELIESILIVARRLVETGLQMQAMLSPSVGEIEALLQRLDGLAQQQQAAIDVSAERQDA
jgi:Mobilization protein NikA